MSMATVTIPFDGRPVTFDVPDRNLAEILSPKPSTPLNDLDLAIDHAPDMLPIPTFEPLG